MIFLSWEGSNLRVAFFSVLLVSRDSIFLIVVRVERFLVSGSTEGLVFLRRKSFLPLSFSTETLLVVGLIGSCFLERLILPSLLTDSLERATLETFRALS